MVSACACAVCHSGVCARVREGVTWCTSVVSSLYLGVVCGSGVGEALC